MKQLGFFTPLRLFRYSLPVILSALATGLFESLSPLSVHAQAGYITTVAGNGTAGYSGDGGPATSAELKGPHDVVFDKSGNMYVADFGNNVVRIVSRKTGFISTLVSGGTGPTSLALDSSGNLYIADGTNDGYPPSTLS